MSNPSKYAPPWYDPATGEEYGPKSIETYQQQVARYHNWAYRKQGPERPEAQLVHLFVGKHHTEIPESEMEVYRLVYVQRLSLNQSAEDSGWSRSTVRSYLKRLKARAEKWGEECTA